VGFLVIDLTWKIFSQTGNIEAYLLMKELESQYQTSEQHLSDVDNEDMTAQTAYKEG